MTTSAVSTPLLYRYRPPTRLSSLSVVMPAHNEAENIGPVILEALEAAAAVAVRYEVVVVDDGSTDATAAIVESMTAAHGDSVRLIRNERNMGYGPTVRRAWASARMDWVLFTDSDRQFDLHEVTRLVTLTDEADLVVGWRKKRQDPVLRRVNAKIFNVAGRLLFGTGIKDIDCAFKLMRASALHKLDLTANSAMVNTELLYQARQHGLRIAQLPVTHLPRQFGQASGGNLKVIARAIREFFTLRHRFNQPEAKRLRLHSRLVAVLAVIAGAAVTAWAYAHQVILAYGDAEAHLNIAKRVVSGLTPGLGQLGSVWLPLPHLLMVPFVVTDAMWRTGLAGAAVGVPSLVLLAVMCFRLAYLLTDSIAASWLAPLVILANPNTLYMAATPMTEVLLLAMVATSVYYLARWVLHGDLASLVLTGLFGSLASVSRYDGWALVLIEAVVVLVMSAVRHRSLRGTEGSMILFGVLAFSGIAGWLLWNQLIFSDPLYFAKSVYGSAQQQQWFLEHGLLPTYHNAGKSVVYWLADVRLIAGSALSVLAATGLGMLAVRCTVHRPLRPVLLIAAAALSSFPFYILSLYSGQASLILPGFAPAGSAYQMSNLRYGLQALLPVALFVAYLAGRRPRVLVPLFLAAVLGQGAVMLATGNVWTYADGTRGVSSQQESKGPDSPYVEAWIRQHYDGGLVLMDDYRRPVGPVESGVPMHDFIGTGNKPYWQESLRDPALYATWIVLQQASTDAVWSGFNAESRAILADHFVVAYQHGNIWVYERRPASANFVVKQGQHLYLNGARWNPVGVNSYDLLAQSQQVIDSRLASLAQGGANTVRTWCFDKDGGISDTSLSKLAVTLDVARAHGLRVICTLANALPDYGGEGYFTPKGQDFFTSPAAQARYRAQVQRVLDYRDAQGVRLADNPAILAWDLLNEPRPAPATPLAPVSAWTEQMGTFADSLDQHHLVTIGAEGFQGGYPANPTLAGTASDNFSSLCRVPAITLCSAHVYPKYLPSPADSEQIGQVVQAWRVAANSLNKPVLLEEVGYALSGGSITGRHAFYDNVARAVNNSDIDGALLWNLGSAADNGFTLAYGDYDSGRVLSQWTYIIHKNGATRRPRS
jgi:Glycosyl transferase family 2/Cellulase (glycosyl hydrolase family 5)